MNSILPPFLCCAAMLLGAQAVYAQPAVVEVNFFVLTDAAGVPAVDPATVDAYFDAVVAEAALTPGAPVPSRCERLTYVDGSGPTPIVIAEQVREAAGFGDLNFFIGAELDGQCSTSRILSDRTRAFFVDVDGACAPARRIAQLAGRQLSSNADFYTSALCAPEETPTGPESIEVNFVVFFNADGMRLVDEETVDAYFAAAVEAAAEVPGAPELVRCGATRLIFEEDDPITAQRAREIAAGSIRAGALNYFLGEQLDGLCGIGGEPGGDVDGPYLFVNDRQSCMPASMIAENVEFQLTTNSEQFSQARCVELAEPTTVIVRTRTVGGSGRARYVIQQMASSALDETEVVAEAGPFFAERRSTPRFVQFDAFGSVDELRVRFVNDDGPLDLLVDYVEVDGQRFQSEAADTYSTGTFDRLTRCEAGFKTSEVLNCNGYFQYDVEAAAGLVDGDQVAARDADADAAQTSISLFPNPSSASVEIRLPASDVEDAVTLRVFDAAGQQVRTYDGLPFGSAFELNADLPAGTYTVRAESGTWRATERLVLLR